MEVKVGQVIELQLPVAADKILGEIVFRLMNGGVKVSEVMPSILHKQLPRILMSVGGWYELYYLSPDGPPQVRVPQTLFEKVAGVTILQKTKNLVDRIFNIPSRDIITAYGRQRGWAIPLRPPLNLYPEIYRGHVPRLNWPQYLLRETSVGPGAGPHAA
jgi:hypothetical protein